MTMESFDEILDFVQENRGESSFIMMDRDAISDAIIMGLNTDTCITHRDKNNNLDGIFIWEIVKYFPLKVEITQCISRGRLILIDMLREFVCLMPQSFICFARRKKQSKIVNYTRRVLRLMERFEVYGKSRN